MPLTRDDRTAAASAPAGETRPARGTRPVADSRAIPGVPRFVPEIQGLRTIALLLVVSFHIWFGRVSGGVDIFLLVSAYLMTRSLASKAATGSWTRPISFTIRKLARLLPAAITTILLTIIAAVMLTSATRWDALSRDALAAMSYTMNLHLQAAETDYFNRAFERTSPFQHFWSLSIQGQVFLLWPIAHLLGEGIARLLRIPLRAVLTALFAVIGIASFLYALHLVGTDQPFAYFDTGARLWEFAAGSLLALTTPLLRLPRALRALMGWTGLAGIVSCGFLLPVEASFPGWAALWPVLSAALLIAASDCRREGPGTSPLPARILASRPLRSIGACSYALYLTHWPVLVLSGTAGDEPSGPWTGLALILISGALAVIVWLLAERPVAAWIARSGSPRVRRERHALRPAIVIITASTIVLGATAAFDRAGKHEVEVTEASLSRTDPSSTGAMNAMGTDATQEPSIVPAHDYLYTSWAKPGVPCPPEDPLASEHCWTSGDPAAAAEGGRNILLVGNSHALQLSPAFEVFIEGRERWAMRSYISPNCSLQPEAWAVGLAGLWDGANECERLWATAAEYAAANPPDLIVVLGTRQEVPGEREQLVPGIEAWARDALPAGTKLAVLRDTPRFESSPYRCALREGFDAPECVMPAPPPPERSWAARVRIAGASWIDLTQTVCPGSRCPPSMGGVVTYFDDNHLTQYFTRTLAQQLSKQLHRDVPWWPERAWG